MGHNAGVPKPLKYLLAWAVATSIGVGVALLGVRVVLESTSAQRPSLVKAPAAVAAGAQVSGTSTPRPSQAADTTARPTRAATPRPSPSRAETAGRDRTAGASRLCADGGTGGRDREDGRDGREDGDRDGEGRDDEAGDGFIQSYEMLGGRAAIRFAPGRVCLVSATPRSGHVVTVVPERPDRLIVRFRSENHQSELDATWVDRPVARSRETFG
jgi:hypothetical protein